MIFVAFSIPIIFCIILGIFFRDLVAWWEYFVVFIPSAILTFIIWACMKSPDHSTEYLGHYVTKTEYYEPWNEYIHQTCSREVPDGKDSEGNTKYRTEYYDCSYVEYHSERFEIYYNDDSYSRSVNEALYWKITERLGGKRNFVDMHRHYHTIDGDMYRCTWPGGRDKFYTTTTPERYVNRVLGSLSIFNFSKVSEEEAKEEGLFFYPPIQDLDQNPILGVRVPEAIVDSFKYLNGFYGRKYQFRCFILIFRDKPISISTEQQNFFVGGNKNELIITMSISKSNKIQWVRAFSWEDEPKMCVSVNHLFHSGDSLDLLKLNRHLLSEVPKNWKRKEFKDFDYIQKELTGKDWKILIWIVVIVNIILSCFVIFNDVYRDE